MAGLRFGAQRKHLRRPDQREPRVANQRGIELLDALPLARLRHRGFGTVPARPEVKHLDVVPVHRQRARTARHMTDEVGQILVERRLVVGVALELLERDRLVPDQRHSFAVLARRDLREVAPLGIPVRVRPRGVVPFHDQRLIAGVEIMLNQSRCVRLLVDERQPRPEPQQALVRLVADAQVRRVYPGRHQRSDHLGIPAADELALATRDQHTQRVEPLGIDGGDRFEREAGGLDGEGRARPLRQTKQRPIAALHDVGTLCFLDRGIRQVQVKDREQLQHVMPCECAPARRPTAPGRRLPRASPRW